MSERTVKFVGRNEKPHDIPADDILVRGQLYGSEFIISLDPNRLNLAWTKGVRTEEGLLAQAVQHEDWKEWLDRQRDEHNGGEWHIKGPHSYGLRPTGLLNISHVWIVIEEKTTALLFKQAFGNQ